MLDSSTFSFFSSFLGKPFTVQKFQWNLDANRLIQQEKMSTVADQNEHSFRYSMKLETLLTPLAQYTSLGESLLLTSEPF